jgi:D-alanine-D-alanine ligase
MAGREKVRVGVVFGGRSGEHAVSLESARFILSVLEKMTDKYAVTQIGITRSGTWLTGDGVLDALQREDTDGLSATTLLADPSRAGLVQIEAMEQDDAKIDVYFPVLHGTFGEDGALQGLFELADVAYVGGGVTASAVGMDKAVFNDVMRANDIPVVDTVLVLRSELQTNMEAILERIERLGDYPFFTKPANLGSSVGVSKVLNRSDLMEGLMEAGEYDRRVIVQRGLNAREIEVSVLGNDRPEASVCGEVLPHGEFYSYESKYHDDRSETVIPADLPEETAQRIRALAVKAYKAIDMAGMARVDFFLDKDTGEVYLNELNTIPGFTQISMYPMLWEASGVSNRELVDRLIQLALERKAERDATKREFRRAA